MPFVGIFMSGRSILLHLLKEMGGRKEPLSAMLIWHLNMLCSLCSLNGGDFVLMLAS